MRSARSRTIWRTCGFWRTRRGRRTPRWRRRRGRRSCRTRSTGRGDQLSGCDRSGSQRVAAAAGVGAAEREQARSAVGLIRALGGDGESCAWWSGWAGGCEVGFAGRTLGVFAAVELRVVLRGEFGCCRFVGRPRAGRRGCSRPRLRSGAFAPDFPKRAPFVILVAACGGCLRIPSGASRLLAAAPPRPRGCEFRRMWRCWSRGRGRGLHRPQKLAARAASFRIRGVLRGVSTLRADTELGKLAASRTAAYREPS